MCGRPRASAVPAATWLRRLAWLLAFWAAGVAALAAVAALLRVAMEAAGLSR